MLVCTLTPAVSPRGPTDPDSFEVDTVTGVGVEIPPGSAGAAIALAGVSHEAATTAIAAKRAFLLTLVLMMRNLSDLEGPREADEEIGGFPRYGYDRLEWRSRYSIHCDALVDIGLVRDR